MIKRLFDIVGSAAALAVCGPLFLTAAVIVKVGSAGPIFFRQTRVGRDGRLFQIYKFRTMQHEAAPAGPRITAGNDPRITRQGRWLRRWKIDELPQLVNVLIGDMSLVGPRPELPCYAQQWRAGERATILAVRPGLTDPATLIFFREEDVLASADDPERFYLDEILPEKTAAYAEYALKRTFCSDLRVLLATLATLFRRNSVIHSREQRRKEPKQTPPSAANYQARRTQMERRCYASKSSS